MPRSHRPDVRNEGATALFRVRGLQGRFVISARVEEANDGNAGSLKGIGDHDSTLIVGEVKSGTDIISATRAFRERSQGLAIIEDSFDEAVAGRGIRRIRFKVAK